MAKVKSSTVVASEETVEVEEKWAISVDTSKPLDDLNFTAYKVTIFE